MGRTERHAGGFYFTLNNIQRIPTDIRKTCPTEKIVVRRAQDMSQSEKWRSEYKTNSASVDIRFTPLQLYTSTKP
jgi:hypothetical protein